MEEAVSFFGTMDVPDVRKAFPKHILVAWWDEDISDLARSLSIFAPRGSNVVIVSAEKPEVLATIAESCTYAERAARSSESSAVQGSTLGSCLFEARGASSDDRRAGTARSVGTGDIMQLADHLDACRMPVSCMQPAHSLSPCLADRMALWAVLSTAQSGCSRAHTSTVADRTFPVRAGLPR